MFLCVNRQRREEGVTVTEGSFMHTNSLSISSYCQLVSEARMLEVHAVRDNYYHEPTCSEHFFKNTKVSAPLPFFFHYFHEL